MTCRRTAARLIRSWTLTDTQELLKFYFPFTLIPKRKLATFVTVMQVNKWSGIIAVGAFSEAVSAYHTKS